MAILALVQKAAIVARGFVLRRSYSVEGWSPVVWEAKGFPDPPPFTSLLLNRPLFEWTKSIHGVTPVHIIILKKSME
jgi:hypothetical protein